MPARRKDTPETQAALRPPEPIGYEAVNARFTMRHGDSVVHVARNGYLHNPSITRRAVLDRDGWTCALCGKAIEDLPVSFCRDAVYGSVDHIVPLARRGPHIWINVQAAHLGCNRSKTDK